VVKVSIIIPTRNRSTYLERAISHAFAQNYPNLEVVVSNNASIDDTAQVLNDLKIKYPQLIIVQHDELLSLNRHWDKVIKEVSEGEIILLIPDDDVIVDVNYISNAVALFSKYPTVGLVFANYYYVNKEFSRINKIEAEFEEFIPKEYLFENYNKDLFGIQGVGVSHCTALFLRQAYRETNGFDLDCMSPDTYLWLKILLSYDAAFIKEKVSEYLIHDGNLSTNATIKQRYSETLIAPKIEQYARNHMKNEPFVQNTINRIDKIFYRRFQYIFLLNLIDFKLEIKYIKYIRPISLFKMIANGIYNRFMRLPRNLFKLS
jgi:glycosyltransferase involved in cell wall biosynthesis